MSEERGARFGEGSVLDRAIDGAVRELLDVEPPAGLRGRVLASIDPVASAFRRKHGFSRKILWTAVPLAAAAALVLALLLPRTESQPQAPATVANNPPAGVETAPPRVDTPRVTETARTQPARPRREERRVARPEVMAVAASADTDVIFGASPDFPRVNALSIPPLTVPTVRTVSSVAPPRELTLDPIAAPAPLGIEPLSLTPPSRHEQERP